MLMPAEVSFKQKRIGQQGQKGAGIAQGIETIRDETAIEPANPGLQEGAGGRKDKIGKPDTESAYP